MSYKSTALACALASNDIHHIHLHASGKQFDRIHNIAQEYYDKLGEELDYLCELSLEKGQSIPNLTRALLEYDNDWYVQSLDDYDYSIAISSIIQILSQYVSDLNDLRETTSDSSVQSELDDMIRYWRKEIDYKLSRRSTAMSSERRD